MNAKHTSTARLRQVVDWSSAVWAGMAGGLIFFLLCFFLVPAISGGNGWVMVRLIASIPMGANVLAPPASFNGTILAVAFITNMALSIGFSLLVAYILHRGGLLTGIVGGALLGAGLYAINFYTLTLVFPWFFGYRSASLFVCHLIFGAICGGVYEALEVEEFETMEAEEEASA